VLSATADLEIKGNLFARSSGACSTKSEGSGDNRVATVGGERRILAHHQGAADPERSDRELAAMMGFSSPSPALDGEFLADSPCD
jgi:hypothetical protein